MCGLEICCGVSISTPRQATWYIVFANTMLYSNTNHHLKQKLRGIARIAVSYSNLRNIAKHSHRKNDCLSAHCLLYRQPWSCYEMMKWAPQHSGLNHCRIGWGSTTACSVVISYITKRVPNNVRCQIRKCVSYGVVSYPIYIADMKKLSCILPLYIFYILRLCRTGFALFEVRSNSTATTEIKILRSAVFVIPTTATFYAILHLPILVWITPIVDHVIAIQTLSCGRTRDGNRFFMNGKVETDNIFELGVGVCWSNLKPRSQSIVGVHLQLLPISKLAISAWFGCNDM